MHAGPARDAVARPMDGVRILSPVGDFTQPAGNTALDRVQTKKEIEELLAQRGLRPRKRFGQHFLIDGNLMRRLAESAELRRSDVVLEVGAGTGGLTDLLAARVDRLVCVEIDDDMFEILSERFGARNEVRLLHGDVLEQKHRLMPELRELLAGFDAEVKLVANLPYDIATPLLMNLLVDYPIVSRCCFTVQAEVGDRIASPPGVKAYGPLSIIVQTLCSVSVVARLGPQTFWPRPLVDSVMLRIDRRRPAAIDGASVSRFSSFVHGVFEHRRKTVRSALEYVVDPADRDRICSVLDGSARPERVPPDDWLAAFRAVLAS